MTSQRIALRIAAILFGLVCIAHIWRLIAQTELQINGIVLPMWPSVIAAIVTAMLTLWMWKLAGRGSQQ